MAHGADVVRNDRGEKSFNTVGGELFAGEVKLVGGQRVGVKIDAAVSVYLEIESALGGGHRCEITKHKDAPRWQLGRLAACVVAELGPRIGPRRRKRLSDNI